MGELGAAFLADGLPSSELESSEELLSAFRFAARTDVMWAEDGVLGVEMEFVLATFFLDSPSDSELLLSLLEESWAFRLTPCTGIFLAVGGVWETDTDFGLAEGLPGFSSSLEVSLLEELCAFLDTD